LSKREIFVEEMANAFTTPVASFTPERGLKVWHYLEWGGRAGFKNSSGFLYCPEIARKRFIVGYNNDWVLHIGNKDY